LKGAKKKIIQTFSFSATELTDFSETKTS